MSYEVHAMVENFAPNSFICLFFFAYSATVAGKASGCFQTEGRKEFSEPKD